MRICDIQIRDPFVALEKGTYYLFGSTDTAIWKGPGSGFDGYVSSAPGASERSGSRPGSYVTDGPFMAVEAVSDHGGMVMLVNRKEEV